ncbi:S-adenosyl-L-methionine-dependent methyltransferase [Mucidula mucida]|nr:S-adenosyl-L-methionine-dependent methyltransferase [Mucidula mucida]
MLRLSRQALRWSHRVRLASRGYTTSLPAVTKIEKIALDSIKVAGPLSFAQYMQLCLAHPTDGYYMNPSNSVFGRQGDFITSPEISQVFGELLGVWFSLQWMHAGKPPAVRLVELGPGRGTLMADILAALTCFVPETAITRVHLVDISPTMRQLQASKLAGRCEVVWNDAINDIEPSDEFTMLVAHEFFDALPINIIAKRPTGWHEVKIDAETTEEAYPRLRRVLTPTPTALSNLLASSSPRFDKLPDGALLEVSQSSFRTARKIGELLAPQGCALIVDYGRKGSYADSFRAFKDHKIVDVFSDPGQCDLTANVDFRYLQEAMADLVPTLGPISQAKFLTKMGLEPRLEALKNAAKTDERREAIESAAKRLVDPDGMGKEYQVLGITTVDEDAALYPFVEFLDDSESSE